jgi:hypothetical protein
VPLHKIWYGIIEGMQNDTRQDARTPNSAARDKAAGTMKEAGGRIKESLGALTGNKRMEGCHTESCVTVYNERPLNPR